MMPITYPVACHTDNVGPGSTFVAIKGYNIDGISFIPKAIELGASKIVVQSSSVLDQNIIDLINKKNIELVFVDDTRVALADLSAQAYGFPAKKLKIIGITGTKGKTTTTYLIDHILTNSGYKVARLSTVKNKILDSEFPAPLTTAQPDYLQAFLDLCVKNNVEYVVIEIAAQGLTLSRVKHINLDCAVFTNFSLEHSEFYSNIDDYFNAKILIFDQLKPAGIAILNADDERVVTIKSKLLHKFKTYTYGLNQADFIGKIDSTDQNFLSGQIVFKDKKFLINTQTLIGQFNFYNILAAVSSLYSLSINLDNIVKAISNFKTVPGRLEKIKLPNGAIGIIDYAHNPSSMEAVLKTLRALTDNLIIVFGTGGDRDKIKRPIMGDIAAQIADTVILTTDNPRSEEPVDIINQIKSGIKLDQADKVFIILDRKEAIEKAYELSGSGSIIALLGKGPDEYQIVKGQKIPFSEAQILRSF